jgi:GTP-binding protein EngB required for normal cell division
LNAALTYPVDNPPAAAGTTPAAPCYREASGTAMTTTPPSTPSPASPQILTEEQRRLLAEDRRLLGDLRAALARFAGAPEDDATLAAAQEQLEELFLLVVAGEFNSGKSAVVNALVGERVLAEGVTPTTDRITVLQHRDHPGGEERREARGIATVVTSAEVLRHLHIVDTPGTNAVLQEHEAVTRDFIPRADMVLFVTSADRPFTESERQFLIAIRDWGKKVALVVNKIDIVEGGDDVRRIEEFVAENARTLLGFTPALFPVSARQALAAQRKLEEGEETAARELLEASRFGALESFVVTTLDEAERVRLKLLNPLKVGLRLAGKYLAAADEREALLVDDFRTLADLEEQLTLYREDMERQYHFRRADVDNVLSDFERRGNDYFESTLRIGRFVDLLQREKIKGEFEREVVADLPQQIDRRVSEIIDWLVGRELDQWEAVRERVARRRSEHADRIVGREGKGFDLDRARLLESIGREAQRTVEGYDRLHEAERLAESVQMAVAGTALIEVGAVGLGAAVAAVASTTAVDVTGILAAGALAALGLFVLPRRRRQAQRELRQKIDEMRGRLTESLDRQFQREMDRGVERIREAVAPYTRFVRAERQSLDSMRGDLDAVRAGLTDLEQRILKVR